TGTQSATVSYTGLDTVDMSANSIANLSFNLPGAADQAILEDAGVAGDGVSRIRSQAALPTITPTRFANPASGLTVNMGGDNGTLTVASAPDLASALAVNGQGGIDNVIFQGVNSFRALTVKVGGSVSDAAGTGLAGS